MNFQRPKGEKTDSEVLEGIPQKEDLVTDALIERLAKDCTDAMKYLPVIKILGILEVTKLRLYDIVKERTADEDNSSKMRLHSN